MRLKTILAIIPMVILVSCISSASPLDQMKKPGKPETGKSTVYGMITDQKTGKPIEGIIVRLAEVHRDGDKGVFLLDLAASPSARTDAQGIYVISNFPPGEYVMAAGDGDNYNNYDIVEKDGAQEAKVWTAVADQVANWGVTPVVILYR